MLSLSKLCFLSLAAIVANAMSDLEKFALLKQVLLCEASHESDAVEHWSRMSFHDLHLQNSAMLRGCLINKDFLNHPGNRGLEEPTRRLFELVVEYLGENALSFGDVIAFSGKVGYESRFPHMNIPFSYGREYCEIESPDLNSVEPTSGSINSLEGLKYDFEYLGITPEEMAILIAGGHGLKEASADDTEFRGKFARVDSGRDYIIKNFNLQWFAMKINGIVQYFNGDKNPKSKKGLIRTPSEMVFYPSRVPQGYFRDYNATSVEDLMKYFSKSPEYVFNQAFSEVYGKMLAIGTSGKEYKEVPDAAYFKCWKAPKIAKSAEKSGKKKGGKSGRAKSKGGKSEKTKK